MPRLTEEDINILKYSWEDWEDFERSMSFEGINLKEKDPILWQAWENYKFAKQLLDRLVDAL